ncbi:hypothetical protein KHA96_08975 [Bacillus sp. FJAT-49711]|uniref:alpha/beta fold hydrolase n=1 Tax=Bacillus sp. FJAT-49711 TaxID=2833585 RepID=UPI001BCA3343|nr:hypothetical protein [Bacillus sp. FJAT-49711]MBS4218442.1 hypothetical protein [Bacillus sp. FJAT-49711]
MECGNGKFVYDTTYGKTHVITWGSEAAPPYVLIHGMTVSPTMWFANIPEWSQHFSLFAIVVMGDFGKSEYTSQSLLLNILIGGYMEYLMD